MRVVNGKKIGVAASNDVSDSGLRKLVESATTIAGLQQDNPDFASLPGAGVAHAPVNAFVERTAGATPEQRAAGVGVICRKCIDAGVTASGAFTTEANETAVANSLGVFAYLPTTFAELSTVVMSDSGSGYASTTSLDVEAIDCEALGSEALAKSLKSRNPVAIDPGEYTVILEEYAVSDLVQFLGMLGLSGLALQEGRSFMKLGEKVVGDNISIWDDGSSMAGLPSAFDFEGVPKTHLDLIAGGVAKAVTYDSYTAGKVGLSRPATLFLRRIPGGRCHRTSSWAPARAPRMR